MKGTKNQFKLINVSKKMWEYLTGDLSHNGVSPKCNEYRGGPGIPGGEVPF